MLKRLYTKIKQIIKTDKRKFIIFNCSIMSMMLLKMKLSLYIVNIFLMFVMKYILLYDLWFMSLFDTDCLIMLQMLIKHCLCNNEMNDIICNMFNRKNNLFSVFIQIKQLVNILKKMMFKLYYINETQISTSIYFTLQQCLCFWVQ